MCKQSYSTVRGGTAAKTQTQMLRFFKAHINGLQGSNRYGIETGVLSLEGVFQ
jgi:hypothetical protein